MPGELCNLGNDWGGGGSQEAGDSKPSDSVQGPSLQKTSCLEGQLFLAFLRLSS